MTIPLTLSAAADADLLDILAHGSATFGAEKAEAYLLEIDATFELIRSYPEIGVIHTTVRPAIRSNVYGRHRIFYDVIDGEILIQRVLHQSQDVRRLL